MNRILSRFLARGGASFVVVLFMMSCHTGSPTPVTYNLANFGSFPAGLIRDVAFISLDPSYPLKSVKHVESVDSSLFVLAFNGLFQYSLDGRFIRQISRQGRSEQEWLSLNAFFYSPTKKALCLIDCSSAKILHYSLEGGFLYTSRISALNKYQVNQAVELSDSGILMANAIYKDNGVIYLYLPDEDQDTIVELESTPLGSEAVQSIGLHPISSVAGSVKCIAPLTNIVRRFDGGGLSKDVVIPTNLPLPDKNLIQEYEKRYSPFTLARACMTKRQFCGYDGIFETERYLILTSFNQYYTVIDKESKECWLLNRCEMLGTLGMPLDDLIGTSSNVIISAISDIRLTLLKQDKCLSDSIKEPFKSFLENAEPDSDRLIIALYTLRD